jgi:hypothetical protein
MIANDCRVTGVVRGIEYAGVPVRTAGASAGAVTAGGGTVAGWLAQEELVGVESAVSQEW